MSFNLYVTTPSGRDFKTLRSPYPSRENTRQTVRIVLAEHDPAAREFAARVAAAPLGVTVRHEKSGMTFRTEEN